MPKVIAKIGIRSQQGTLQVSPGHLCLIVGANNSGKSLLLTEISAWSNGGLQSGGRILASAEYTSFGRAEAQVLLNARIVATPDPMQPGRVTIRTSKPGLGEIQTLQVDEVETLTHLELGNLYSEGARSILSTYAIDLNGSNRLNLLNGAEGAAISGTLVGALATDGSKRHKVREAVARALGQHLVVDIGSPLGTASVKLNLVAPTSDEQELGYTSASMMYHARSKALSAFSDGVKAYCGMIATLHASDYRIICIDEPEAFLAPPLAKQLGRALADVSASRHGCAFVATHSAEVVYGAVESGNQVTIVALQFNNGVGSARALLNADVHALMQDPLVRSTDSMSALFHKGAVVCEADADRVLYREINERLLADGATGCQDTIFLNAQNKQTIQKIAAPLRRLGVPAAALVDFDIIKQDDLERLLDSLAIPAALRSQLVTARDITVGHFATAGVDPKSGGLGQLTGKAQTDASAFIQLAGTIGVFIVDVGELEYWLQSIGVKPAGKKSQWLQDAFAALGSDPNSATYVKRGAGDIWSFLESIGAWIANPSRLGMA